MLLQPLIDGFITLATAILLTAGTPTAAYQWDPAEREPDRTPAESVLVEAAVEAVVDGTCIEVVIGWDEYGPYKISGGTPEIRTSVVGTYLWVMVGDPVIETGYVEDYVHSIPLTPGDDTIQVCA